MRLYKIERLKKIVFTMLLFTLFYSCARDGNNPATGIAYSDVKFPGTVTYNKLGKKVGSASYESYLGIVALGDAGIDKIAKEAGITTISHVDYHSVNYFVLYAKGTVYVYGN
jgi:hypothetical protein